MSGAPARADASLCTKAASCSAPGTSNPITHYCEHAFLPAAQLLAQHHLQYPSCAGGRCCLGAAASAALHLRRPHAQQLLHALRPSPSAGYALTPPHALLCSDTLQGQQNACNVILLVAAHAAGSSVNGQSGSLTSRVGIPPGATDWAAGLLCSPNLTDQAHILHHITPALAPGGGSLYIEDQTAAGSVQGSHLHQCQEMELALIVHEAVCPWPIHNDAQWLPCTVLRSQEAPPWVLLSQYCMLKLLRHP